MSESKHTADAIMGLVKEYGARCYASGEAGLYRKRSVDELESAIRAIIEERDQAVAECERRWKQYKELVYDFLPDNECLPECNSYGHSDECPVVYAQAASRKVIQDRDALRAENERLTAESRELREGIDEIARDLWNESGASYAIRLDRLTRLSRGTTEK